MRFVKSEEGDHPPSPSKGKGGPGGGGGAHKILLLDGSCVLCSWAARFVVRHEAASSSGIWFASLTDPMAPGVLARYGLSEVLCATRLRQSEGSGLRSVVFIDGQKGYEKSDAVLEVARYLRSPWCYLRIFRGIPRPIRDLFYGLVAATRYRVWGRREACYLESGEVARRHVSLSHVW